MIRRIALVAVAAATLSACGSGGSKPTHVTFEPAAVVDTTTTTVVPDPTTTVAPDPTTTVAPDPTTTTTVELTIQNADNIDDGNRQARDQCRADGNPNWLRCTVTDPNGS